MDGTTANLSSRNGWQALHNIYALLVLFESVGWSGLPATVNSTSGFLQVLREPSTRLAYDQQLALAAAQQQAFVSQTVMLADMELVKMSVEDSTCTPASADTAYQYPCRCGGAYWLDDMVLDVSQGSVLVQCDTCSSNIEISLKSP